MKMSAFWHKLAHIGAVLLQLAIAYSGVIPGKAGAVVAGAIAAVQGGIAVYNHGKGK
jgi:hypothetical protein